jgi:two-component system, NtrC family, sensor kinase
MENELTRSTKLVRNLLDFARQTPPTLRQTDINEVIQRAVELIGDSMKMPDIKIVREFAAALPRLHADPDQLLQVFINLILNAVQAMTGGGTLLLRTGTEDKQIRIDVQDTGSGIAPENMGKLFTPFFTTKKEVKGVGLGLAVSYGIIQRHHGKIIVKSKEGEGTVFSIYLPVKNA